MNKNYQTSKIDTTRPAVPERVSIALAEITTDLREGLLALAVGAGLRVLTAMMEADVTAASGPRDQHNRDRTAVRHGHGPGSVPLGGRRIPVTRPRIRAVEGTGELPVASYEVLNDTDVLGRMALERYSESCLTTCPLFGGNLSGCGWRCHPRWRARCARPTRSSR